MIKEAIAVIWSKERGGLESEGWGPSPAPLLAMEPSILSVSTFVSQGKIPNIRLIWEL